MNKYQRQSGVFPVCTCPACGKLVFTSRKNALRFARRNNLRDGHLNAYPCPRNPGAYHFGHQPEAVTSGKVARADLACNRV